MCTLSVSLAPTPTCQPSLNLAPIASLGQGYYCIWLVYVCQNVRNARIAYHLKTNHLKASDHKTSLANYYPLTLGNLRQLSNGHLSMQHLSWRPLSILAISQLLLARFWLNFKGKFLWPFLTYPNCHRHLSIQYLYWQQLSIWLIS